MSWGTGASAGGGGGWGAPVGGAATIADDEWGTPAAANNFSGGNAFDADEGANGFTFESNENGGGGGRVNDGACFNCGEQG